VFRDFPVTKIIYELGQDNLLPAILFRSARKQCDADIEALENARGGKLRPIAQGNLQREIDSIIAKYGMEREIITTHPHYQALLTTGAGAHHAGQLLLWRLLLEELMSRGALRLMIATGTVAAGVDFPARTVVVTAHSKRGSEGFGVLTATEFQQMAGRAGRRGKDAVGIVLIAPGVYSDARVFHQLTMRPPEPLRSAYFAAPSTVLNLLKFRNADELRYTVSKSLAAFLDRKSAKLLRSSGDEEQESFDRTPGLTGERRKKAEKRVRRKYREAEILEARQAELLEQSLQGLERLGYVRGGVLTAKGGWAANLCTSLVLELAEAVEAGLLDDLSVEELVALIGSIAGDPHRPYFSLRENPIKREYFEKMTEIVSRVRDSFQNPQNTEVAVIPNAALTLLTWMDARDWVDFAGILRLNGVAEGDCARLITQTADHLNQLSRLHETHPVLAAAAEEGRRRILRPPLSEVLLEVG
jgi:ATP-dependent RNA helicase HelY